MIFLPHFTRSILLRLLAAWLVVRTAVMLAGGAAGAALGLPPPADPWLLTPRAALLVVAVVAATGAVSLRRNHDLFFLALGFGRLRQACALVLPVLAAEIVLGVAQRL